MIALPIATNATDADEHVDVALGDLARVDETQDERERECDGGQNRVGQELEGAMAVGRMGEPAHGALNSTRGAALRALACKSVVELAQDAVAALLVRELGAHALARGNMRFGTERQRLRDAGGDALRGRLFETRRPCRPRPPAARRPR